MSQWIDFKQLRSRLKFPDVLGHYGVRLNIRGDQAQGFCPLPNHKGERRSPSFSANLSRGIWQCFGCGAKGNLLDFAVCMEGLSPDHAADVRTVALKLAERFQIHGVTKKQVATGKRSTANGETPRREAASTGAPLFPPVTEQAPSPTAPSVRINQPLDFELKGLQPDHPYLTGRGFSANTIQHFGLGYCSRGFMTGRVAIPLHNPSGQLVGYAGRIIDDSLIGEECPKYKFPSKRERDGMSHEFHKSHLVYNAHRIKGTVDHLVVVEGFPSVWWLHQMGIQATVALMGWSCSPEQGAILLEMTTATSGIFVFTDGDEAGDRCAHGVFSAVGSKRWIRRIQLTDGRQPTDCQPDELTSFFRA